MTAIVDEVEFVLLRSSFSSIITEALDATCAVFNARGHTVAQACAIPMKAGQRARTAHLEFRAQDVFRFVHEDLTLSLCE